MEVGKVGKIFLCVVSRTGVRALYRTILSIRAEWKKISRSFGEDLPSFARYSPPFLAYLLLNINCYRRVTTPLAKSRGGLSEGFQ
jgi:hypothetical protein